jgi:hypothetical protein
MRLWAIGQHGRRSAPQSAASLPRRAQLQREALTLGAVCSALTDSDSLSIAQVHKNPFGLRYRSPLLFVIGCFMEALAVVLFVVARIAEIRFEVMARAIVPWLVPLVVVLAAITLWPPLTLWLATARRGV